STRFTIVRELAKRAFAIHKTPKGLTTLARLGREVVEARIKAASEKGMPATQLHIYRGSLDNMGTWINTFLWRLEHGFPEIHLKRLGTATAETNKMSWGYDMAAYQPRNAAWIVLNSTVIENMASLRGTAHHRRDGTSPYEIMEFEMTVSFAHEMVHLLTGYLTGDVTPHTPPHLTAGGYEELDHPDGPRGELGWYWEHGFLGGILEFWAKKDELKERQAVR
ncbi:hypothetical protein C8A05DRAFT_15800, partial [Staphylotrichum tortipilum]